MEVIESLLRFLHGIFTYFYFNIFFRKFKKDLKNIKADILFSSNLLNWRAYIHQKGNYYKDDLMLGDTISKSKNYFNIVGLDIPFLRLYFPFRSFMLTKSKFNKSKDWICLEQFITLSILFRTFFKYITRSFTREDVFFCSIFSKNSRSGFSKFNISFKLAIFKEILVLLKPKIIFLSCEYDFLHKIATYYASKQGIPVIALQHGVITPIHPGYIYNKKDKVILPNITCVYGQYHYDLLTKKSVYKPEQVVVTGSPRYDVLYYADKIYNRERFCKRYKINPKHKIILWTTQTHGLSYEENIKNLKAMFNTMEKLKDVTLIIKQHPGELKKHTNLIKKYLKKYKINVIITPKDSDTYEQIFVCDLMITRHSTTGIEAVALNKPIIVLNLSGDPDPVNYVEDGVALGVYEEYVLKSTIENLLKDDSVLAKNRKKFIRKYLYKFDGKATERVVNIIGKMIKKRREKNGK